MNPNLTDDQVLSIKKEIIENFSAKYKELMNSISQLPVPDVFRKHANFLFDTAFMWFREGITFMNIRPAAPDVPPPSEAETPVEQSAEQPEHEPEQPENPESKL